ncbi:MAG: U32 family peptidase [Alphaproteobacteria bacterium]|nr:U32 family peptidase [Alphaproteobacteria bacterium]
MPAGSLEKLKVAVLYGADAVYMGTPDLSLRAKSQMSLEQVQEGVAFAHAHGKRAYLTLNLFSHNSDIEKLHDYLAAIRQVKPDGLIVADVGVFQFVKTHAPELELHISTQANVCSWLSVKFWEEIGAKLIVLAREVSFDELKEIREKCPDIKLEAFIHGSMCMTYSGRCLLSNYMAERGANQGSCTNSCRWKYKVHMRLKDGSLKELELTKENRELFEFFLEEEHRAGELMPLEEDDRGSYILNAKDLCLMPKLSEYLALGIDSLKVEGRNRSAYYLAITTRAYRMAIDAWYRDPEHWSPAPYMRELNTIPNRGYSLAFHEGRLTHHAHNYEDTQTLSEWEYAGTITEVRDDCFILEVKNRLEAGDVLEFVPFGAREPMLLRIYEFEDLRNHRTTREEGVHAGAQPLLRIPFAWFHEEKASALRSDFPAYSVVRKERALSDDEWARLALDRSAMKTELGKSGEARYQEKRVALVEARQAEHEGKEFRSPRLGTEGCCGRGCNGCLPFWHDTKYAKARDLLKQKKQGERLSVAEAR